MSTPSRILFGIGAIAVSAAIGFDAWHAHGLRESLETEAHEAFGRGIRLHYMAGIGMVLGVLLLALRPSKIALAAGCSIGLGGLIFCVEVYRGASELPGEFHGMHSGGNCGAVVVWTKRTVDVRRER